MKKKKRQPATTRKKASTKKRSPGQTRARSRPKSRPKRARRRPVESGQENAESGLIRELSEHFGVSPADSGGDVDADWQRAQSSGEEAVGGSVATPDQDVVDELARPFGVERPPDAPVMTSEEILRARDRRRWRREQSAGEQTEDADDRS